MLFPKTSMRVAVFDVTVAGGGGVDGSSHSPESERSARIEVETQARRRTGLIAARQTNVKRSATRGSDRLIGVKGPCARAHLSNPTPQTSPTHPSLESRP